MFQNILVGSTSLNNILSVLFHGVLKKTGILSNQSIEENTRIPVSRVGTELTHWNN